MKDMRNTKPYRRLAKYYTSPAMAEEEIDRIVTEQRRLRERGDQHTPTYNRLELRRQRLALLLADLLTPYII